jgi:hypothetical protein
MHLKKVIAAATIPAMVASPVAAANPAASLSLRGDSNEAAGSSDSTAATAETAAAAAQPYAAEGAAGGISSPLLIGGLALALVIIGAVALGSGHHGSHPASA